MGDHRQEQGQNHAAEHRVYNPHKIDFLLHYKTRNLPPKTITFFANVSKSQVAA